MRDRVAIEQPQQEVKKDLPFKVKKKISEVLDKMVGTRAAYIFDESMKLLGKIPLTQFTDDNKRLDKAKIVAIDGEINSDILNIAEAHEIEFLAANSSERGLRPRSLKIFIKEELNE